MSSGLDFRVDSVVLTGLDFSMKPANVRCEVISGFIRPFPEAKVMHQIKSLAIMVYNQEKVTPQFHANVCDGRNTLAYFICAVHRQQVPQSQTHLRKIVTASNDFRDSCHPINSSTGRELPILNTSSMLPLGYWDSLYYAVLAEVRVMHEELQKEYGFGRGNNETPLHHMGQDGTSNAPITAVDLASMLESAWYSLMDSRLVATLDEAVHLRHLQETDADSEFKSALLRSGGHDPTTELELAPSPFSYGLIDINALTPESIVAMLWDKHKPEIDRTCQETLEDEFMITSYRAERNLKATEDGMAVCRPLTASFSACQCHNTCPCRLECDLRSNNCQCQHRVRIYHLVREQEHTQAELDKMLEEEGKNCRAQYLYGAATNGIARMQLSALANSTDINVQACFVVNDALQKHEHKAASRARARAATQDSGLAYVPGPGTPFRPTKDAFPLGLYGGDSGQRYPKMAMPSMNTQQPPPVYGQSQGDSSYSSRKPLFEALLQSQGHPLDVFRHHSANGMSCTILPTQTADFSSNENSLSTGSKQYPSKQIAQTPLANNFVDRSRATHTAANTTQDLGVHDSRKMVGSENSLAQDYIDLLPDSPFCFDIENDVEHQVVSSVSSPADVVFGDVGHLDNIPSLQELAANLKPDAILPVPDFISPRPALQQRYVCAGGDARLEDRPEIPGPPFAHKPVAGTSGVSISKEQVDSKLSDAEWVLKNFNVVIKPDGSVKAADHRSSEGSDIPSTPVDRAAEKRERTSSEAAVHKRPKFMRVFSRNNSQGVSE